MTKTKLLFIGMALALVTWVGASAASAQDQTLTADPASVSEAGTYDFTLTPSGFTAATNLAVCITGDSSLLTGQAALMQYCGGFGSSQDNSGPFTVEGVEVDGNGVTFLLFELAVNGESASASVNIAADDSGDMGDGDDSDATDDSGSDDTTDDSDDSGDMDDGDDSMGDEDTGDDSGDMGDEDTGDDSGDMDDADDSMDDGDDSGDMDDADDSMDDGDMDGDDSMDDGDMDGDDSMDDGDMGDEAMDDGDMGDGDMDDDMAEDTTMPATGSNTPLLAIIALAVVLAGAMFLGLSRRLRTQ